MELKEVNTRVAFRDSLIELADADERYALVCSDSALVFKAGLFQEKFPERYFDVGISEQNAVGVAAGMASSGFVPFFGTYSGFITMRACEQVRTFVAYPGLNVNFIGANGGMGSGEREGVSHQFFEDLGILRTFPGMTIVVPSNADQVNAAVKAVAIVDGPSFIRVGSGRDVVCDLPDLPAFELGKAKVLRDYGNDVALFTMGFTVPRVLQAADELRSDRIDATVVEVSTLKPLDAELISEVLDRTRAAVTVEDHNIIGGLGSAVAEVIAERSSARLKRIGLQDVFPESGMPDELYDKYGMSIKDITDAAKITIKEKELLQ